MGWLLDWMIREALIYGSHLWVGLNVKKEKKKIVPVEGTAGAVQGHSQYVGGTKKEDSDQSVITKRERVRYR